jgi:molybdopterin biosynthesis enzyme MoaB
LETILILVNSESLNTQHLETKIKLLKETLTNRNTEFKEYEGVQKNNEQLLSLLEKYDDKVTEMQTEIDIRDLRIE